MIKKIYLFFILLAISLTSIFAINIVTDTQTIQNDLKEFKISNILYTDILPSTNDIKNNISYDYMFEVKDSTQNFYLVLTKASGVNSTLKFYITTTKDITSQTYDIINYSYVLGSNGDYYFKFEELSDKQNFNVYIDIQDSTFLDYPISYIDINPYSIDSIFNKFTTLFITIIETNWGIIKISFFTLIVISVIGIIYGTMYLGLLFIKYSKRFNKVRNKSLRMGGVRQ